jgi:hypothetical protein
MHFNPILPFWFTRLANWRRVASNAALLLATLPNLPACTEPPSWQKLLAIKITDQLPAFTAEPAPGGGLTVKRPGLPDAPVDVDGIARFCQRGPKDCDYAIDQMLLELRGR